MPKRDKTLISINNRIKALYKLQVLGITIPLLSVGIATSSGAALAIGEEVDHDGLEGRCRRAQPLLRAWGRLSQSRRWRAPVVVWHIALVP